jgi:hypothetical protein
MLENIILPAFRLIAEGDTSNAFAGIALLVGNILRGGLP